MRGPWKEEEERTLRRNTSGRRASSMHREQRGLSATCLWQQRTTVSLVGARPDGDLRIGMLLAHELRHGDKRRDVAVFHRHLPPLKAYLRLRNRERARGAVSGEACQSR
eukprot:SAG11_NODE_26675_length_342_cov_0.851852_1_plen_108_part_10